MAASLSFLKMLILLPVIPCHSYIQSITRLGGMVMMKGCWWCDHINRGHQQLLFAEQVGLQAAISRMESVQNMFTTWQKNTEDGEAQMFHCILLYSTSSYCVFRIFWASEDSLLLVGKIVCCDFAFTKVHPLGKFKEEHLQQSKLDSVKCHQIPLNRSM